MLQNSTRPSKGSLHQRSLELFHKIKSERTYESQPRKPKHKGREGKKSVDQIGQINIDSKVSINICIMNLDTHEKRLYTMIILVSLQE